MGAFHNQIRENETFESLLELYRQEIKKNRLLKTLLNDVLEEVHSCCDCIDYCHTPGLHERLDETLGSARM